MHILPGQAAARAEQQRRDAQRDYEAAMSAEAVANGRRMLNLNEPDMGRTMSTLQIGTSDVWNAGEPYPDEPGPITPVDIRVAMKVERDDEPYEAIPVAMPHIDRLTSKDTNPKDAVGIKKWRQFTTIPLTVMAELGVAMLEGARKYGKHNYRVAGVRASVYVDAAMGHIMQWWEGENTDADSGLSHITKAIASLTVLRDAMIQDKLVDDRPPPANLGRTRQSLQDVVDDMFERHPDPKKPYTAKEQL